MATSQTTNFLSKNWQSGSPANTFLMYGFNLAKQIGYDNYEKIRLDKRKYDNERQLLAQLGVEKYAMDLNEHQAALDRQFYEDYYNKYQSPAAMARQYQEAGLNPYAAVGATSSFDSSSMANRPQVDPSSLAAPIAQYGDRLLSKQQMEQERLFKAFSTAAQMAQTVGSLVQQGQQIKAQRIENENNEFYQRMMQTPVGQAWLRLLPGFESIADDSSFDGPNFKNPDGVPGLSFGQLLHLGAMIQNVKNLNESGAGFYSNNPQDPWSHYLRSVAYQLQKRGISWNDADDFTKYSPWIAAYDVVNQTNLAGISQHKYQQWYNDWQINLRKKGLNPEGNDLFNTAMRIIHQNTPENDFDFMLDTLGNGLGKAAKRLGNIFNLFLDADDSLHIDDLLNHQHRQFKRNQK